MGITITMRGFIADMYAPMQAVIWALLSDTSD